MLHGNQYFHCAGLIVTLTILWLLLSGHYTFLLLGLGLLSIIFVTLTCLRMEIFVVEKAEVLSQIIRYIPYSFWLLLEIIKSNINVIKCILDPALPISPRWLTIQATQDGDFARVIYANSITLTPGTISIDVDGNNINVHALSDNSVDGLTTGEMDQRVTAAEKKYV